MSQPVSRSCIPKSAKSDARTIPLAVLADGGSGAGGSGPRMKKSKMGWRRAVVLGLVQAAMIAHGLVWWFQATRHPERPAVTLTPVEPSESMSTLEVGNINAGFVFFGVAILSTLIFGRWFCGWGCHIVALQDLCSWMMKKIGIHPKPFRSRLLVIAPLLLALYMFVWPTLKREVVKPLVVKQWGNETKEQAFARWIDVKVYLGDAGPRPGLRTEFTTNEFWKTFAPWYVAIPFFGVCGFVIVYFLGSKGFCTYGCPYGGFFGPADKIAPGRILVTDACEHCGHCTSVCTSNVRVHEEVRDFGMVVDSGCMKCMDCVSVCPNDALSFSFAAPAVLAKPRTKEARAGHIQRPEYDVTLGQDWLLFG